MCIRDRNGNRWRDFAINSHQTRHNKITIPNEQINENYIFRRNTIVLCRLLNYQIHTLRQMDARTWYTETDINIQVAAFTKEYSAACLPRSERGDKWMAGKTNQQERSLAVSRPSQCNRPFAHCAWSTRCSSLSVSDGGEKVLWSQRKQEGFLGFLHYQSQLTA